MYWLASKSAWCTAEDKILEITLDLCDGRRCSRLLWSGHIYRGHGWRGRWRWILTRLGLLFGRARYLVFNSGRSRYHWFLVCDGDLESKLELSLRSTVELLVDSSVVGVQDDKCSCTVGVTFEDDIGRWWNSKEEAKLSREMSVLIWFICKCL